MLTTASIQQRVPGQELPLIKHADGPRSAISATITSHREQGLFDAVTQLSGRGISDLVLDMRYNGGGYLARLAARDMSPARTTGKTSRRTVFNDKHPTTDPVTGQTIKPTPFVATDDRLGRGLPSAAAAQPRPVARVLLTGPGTVRERGGDERPGRIDVDRDPDRATTCGQALRVLSEDNSARLLLDPVPRGQQQGLRRYPMASSPGAPGSSRTAARRRRLHARARRSARAGWLPRCPTGPLAAVRRRHPRCRSAPASICRGRREVPKSVWRQNRICGPEPVDAPAGRSVAPARVSCPGAHRHPDSGILAEQLTILSERGSCVSRDPALLPRHWRRSSTRSERGRPRGGVHPRQWIT